MYTGMEAPMKQKNYKDYLATILPCIGFSILCGAVTGAVILPYGPPFLDFFLITLSIYTYRF